MCVTFTSRVARQRVAGQEIKSINAAPPAGMPGALFRTDATVASPPADAPDAPQLCIVEPTPPVPTTTGIIDHCPPLAISTWSCSAAFPPVARRSITPYFVFNRGHGGDGALPQFRSDKVLHFLQFVKAHFHLPPVHGDIHEEVNIRREAVRAVGEPLLKSQDAIAGAGAAPKHGDLNPSECVGDALHVREVTRIERCLQRALRRRADTSGIVSRL